VHFVYILYSRSIDAFYIGESDDPERRLIYHNNGMARFTARASDWDLVFKKDCNNRSSALMIESKIKSSKSRKSILRWIKGSENQIVFNSSFQSGSPDTRR